MERTLLIRHNWHNRDESKWLFWLEKKLTQLGFSVSLADLPEDTPKDSELVVGQIQDVHGVLPHNTIIVRHDPGCLTLLKYCEQLLKQQTMEPTLLIAGIPKQQTSASILKMIGGPKALRVQPEREEYTPHPEALTLQTMDLKLVVIYGGQLTKALPIR